MKVIKRDGKQEEFNEVNIRKAIKAANNSVDKEKQISDEKVEKVLNFVLKNISSEEKVEIEKIQDLVEDGLMKENCFEVAKSFILYREERAKERFKRLKIVKEIKEKLEASNIQNQNANLDEASFGGRKGEADSALLKQMALDYYISPKFAKNHINNRVYIHDLDSYLIGEHNCVEQNSWVKVVIDGMPKTLKLKELGKIVGITDGEINVENLNIQILSRDGYTLLKKIWVRETDEDESVFELKTLKGLPLIVTGEHKLPVLRDGKELILKAKDIVEGDSLLQSNFQLSSDDYKESFLNLLDLKGIDLRIVNGEKLYKYLSYKYDVYYTNYAKEKKLSNANCISGQNMTVEDLKVIMNDFALDWEVLSTLRVKASGSKKTYPLFIPYSENLAKLYAYIYADGGVYVNEEESLYQLTFTNTNERIVDDFIKCYKDVFGYSLNKSYPKSDWTSPCIRVTDGSRLAVKIFKDFAGAKKYGSADISIPDFVMNGNENIKYAYLSAAMDTDGSFSENIIYTTCGEKYSEQFCIILQSLGYTPSKRLQNKKGSVYRIGKVSGTRNFNCYSIVINRNNEKIDFAEKVNTIKFAEKYSYKGCSKNFDNSKIIKIKTISDKKVVYDLETESHWFIVNNYVSHNCLSVPIDELLANGFKTRQVFIRPAGSANTAFQLVAVLFQLQSLQQFGGVSATHLDWSLVPYVRKSFMKHYIVAYLKDTRDFYRLNLPDMMFNDYKDEGGIWRNELEDWIDEHKEKFFRKLKLKKEDFYFDNKKLNKTYRQAAVFDTIQEVKQAAEGMLHNLNSLQSRSGNQLPFSSINYGTCTEEEGRIVVRAILGATIRGVGNGQTSIFPCQIFQKMKGVNDKGSKNYDLYKMAIRSSAKRMYPNYCNCDWSQDQGYNDMEYKTSFINSLTEEQKNNIIKAIEKNPEIGEKLGLYIKEVK